MAYAMENILPVICELTKVELNRERAELLCKMKSDFKKLQDYVQAVEMKAVHDEHVHAWTSKVKSLAEEVEAVLVAYHLHALNVNQISASTRRKHLKHFLGKISDTVSAIILKILPKENPQNKPMSPEGACPLLLRTNSTWLGLSNLEAKYLPAALSRVGDHIRSLRERLIFSIESKQMVPYLENVVQEETKLRQEARAYNLEPAVNSRKTYPFSTSAQDVEEATSMVGREDIVRKVRDYLMEKKQKTVIVSLTGRAGIGKTTVAAAIYKRVKQHFDCHAWVSVSQKSQPRILQDILTNFLDSLSTMAPRNLEALPIAKLREKIRLLLEGKQFLLFLDDLQRNSDQWECIQNAFPVGCKGNIVITTRYPGTVPISEGFEQNLGRLSSHQSLQLLRQRALLEDNDSEFWSLVESLAKEIAEMSEGNPLAISMIGGMLSAKREISEWNTVHERLKMMDYIPCCYADLQPVLKSCFHYCSLLPPQYEISCKRLARLWIAEGFIEHELDGRTMEETATYQLYELIKRGMIQVGKVGLDGEIITCQVLRVVQDFALQQSSIDRFPNLLDSEGSSFTKSGYRLSLHDSTSNAIVKFGNLNLNKLYSFMVFTRHKDHPNMITSNCTFKLLLVLELQHLPLENLPKAVEDLILLMYLGLRATRLKALPISLKKLVRLQTLDIRDTSIRAMPTGLDNWMRLRHLLLASSFDDKAIGLSDVEVERFQDLQTLAGLKLTEDIATGLRHLSQLKKLSVGMIEIHLSFPLLESIQHLELLQSLTMKCAPGEKIELKSQLLPRNLKKLRVGGHIKNLVHAINHLKFLRFLYVWDCEVTEDPLPLLCPLHNLVVLSLCNAYVGEKMSLEETYPQLRKLSILRFKYLKKCGKIVAGSLQKLEMLTIGHCPRLKNPPQGLENLTSIQEMQLASMPPDFVNEVKEFHSKRNDLKFSLVVRGMNDHELVSTMVPPTTVSFPPSLPPYDFSRAQSTNGQRVFGKTNPI